jgi:hypothetical protein
MKMTQKEMILEHLKGGAPIDARYALDAFGVMRLAACVFDLRTQGHNIISERKVVTNRYGDECSVANYKLIGERNE